MLIIDTRTPLEFHRSHIEGAINLPLQLFEADKLPPQLLDISKDHTILLYDMSGERANQAVQCLVHHGFSQVTNGVNQQYVEKLLNIT